MEKLQYFKLVAGISVIALSLAIGLSAVSFVSPYRYVSDVLAEPDRYMVEEVQVAALIVDGTYERRHDASRFTITDGTANMDVVFIGSEPPAFRHDTGIVVIGKLGSDGSFKATMMLAKCPSKYEQKIRAAQQGS